MSVGAVELVIGDMVNLHEDPIFDYDCMGPYCIHRSQDAELIEVEPLPERRFRMTFQNQAGNDPVMGMSLYTGEVPWNYAFVEAQ